MGVLAVGLRVLLIICCFCCVRTQSAENLDILLTTIVESLNDLREKVNDLSNHQLAQDLAAGERSRTGGQSGVKLVRQYKGGSRPYMTSSYAGSRMAGMHNHANFERVIGLGELVAVLNGYEFRTRHNDYSLVQPSVTSELFHSTQDIPFPNVPWRILRKQTVDEQVLEMREWFKAWRDQDYSVRDYRPYFKANLCYLEGAFYYPDEILVDQIHSERHQIQSPDFVHLQKQFKYSSESGRKDDLENMAYLPRVVYRVVNGTPEYAQWNYRLLCHPIDGDVPLNRFRVIDELHTRMRFNNKFSEFPLTMRARFQLNSEDADSFPTRETATHYEYLDKLMDQIPGLNNYRGYLEDDTFNSMAYRMDTDLEEEMVPLNVARYHRWFMSSKAGAMGHATRHRGFNDNNLFVAMNTQSKVVPTEVEHCSGSGRGKVCVWHTQRFSYAIPLEIVYTTPLSKWNPYDIEHKGNANSDYGKTVRMPRRNGRPTLKSAYNGVNSHTFYITPAEFFTGGELASDPADTTGRGATGVLDREGNVRLVRDSGHRIFLPDIPGVGILRQRFPIMPIYGEGNSLWKEVEALKDIVLDYDRYQHMYRSNREVPDESPAEEAIDTNNRGLVMELLPGRTGHSHLVYISVQDLGYLHEGQSVILNAEESDGHGHEMAVSYKAATNTRPDRYVVTNIRPMEGHSRLLEHVVNPEVDVNSV